LKSILILGGARSGKSRYALELGLKSHEPVLFVATAEAGDDEMRRRIEEHRKARPAAWDTLEVTTDIGGQIRQKAGKAQTVIVDCITLLINNILLKHSDPGGELIDTSLVEKEVVAEIAGLVECMKQGRASFIIVSNEVGLGLVPANRMGRLYRDLLGMANQMLARQADEVYFMVAGLPVPIKPVKS
jgi:adenosylcobinamide kinase/adenosylcobinamide-phosphate guanylyltransferase